MAELATEYKCPACSGPMSFDPVSGKMKCDYCDSIYSIEEAKSFVAERNKEVLENAANPSTEESYWDVGDGMKSYSCKSCGAELVCDETTAATSCPYCGSPTVMPQQFQGMMKPKYVIPFKVLKNDAQNKLTSYCKGKKLLPNSFTNGNHISEVKGVYVPFWLYSGAVEADIHYKAEKVEEKKTSTEKITITHHYEVHRRGVISFDKIPSDASSSMPDDLMDSIEPYDYKDLTGFEMEYLPGYIADKYDVEKEAVLDRSQKRVDGSATKIIRDTVEGYTNVYENGKNLRFFNEKQEYAMFPVWLLSTQWNNQNFLFAVNGQTGKMIGNLPIDNGKRWAWLLGIGLPVFLLAAIFMGFDGFAIIGGLVAGVIAALITNGVLTSSMKPVKQSSQAANYVVENNRGNKDKNVRLSIRDDRFIRTTEKREPLNKD